MTKLFADTGVIALTAFISPFREDRKKVRALLQDDFIEVYCQCDISVCESRDVKGLYKKAREGEIKDFTGISSPYEEPEQAEITVNTGGDTLENCVDKIIQYLIQNEIVSREKQVVGFKS
jgi:adenylylsulfate kinase